MNPLGPARNRFLMRVPLETAFVLLLALEANHATMTKSRQSEREWLAEGPATGPQEAPLADRTACAKAGVRLKTSVSWVYSPP